MRSTREILVSASNNFVARQLEPFITEECKADSMRSTPGGMLPKD